ncbi:MAG: SH3 domain-containing protein, partial [Actinomycetota bacterium]|nr:SH3 domain-containing protein [Actinomycetota bacterium]
DDVLNVREAPGIDRDIVTTLAPTASGIVAEGHTRFLPNSVWYQVTANGVTGWASARFLAFLGNTDDATAEIVSDLGGLPTEETLLDLGQTIASTMVSVEPASRVTVTEAPTVGDLADVTIDIVGLGDDALAGFRLHIFAQPDGDGWALKSVERTILCTRGLSGGLCT